MIVQYVIRNLERQSQRASVSGNPVEILACGSSDYRSDTGCCRDQRACLQAIEILKTAGVTLRFSNSNSLLCPLIIPPYPGCPGYLANELCDQSTPKMRVTAGSDTIKKLPSVKHRRPEALLPRQSACGKKVFLDGSRHCRVKAGRRVSASSNESTQSRRQKTASERVWRRTVLRPLKSMWGGTVSPHPERYNTWLDEASGGIWGTLCFQVLV